MEAMSVHTQQPASLVGMKRLRRSDSAVQTHGPTTRTSSRILSQSHHGSQGLLQLFRLVLVLLTCFTGTVTEALLGRNRPPAKHFMYGGGLENIGSIIDYVGTGKDDDRPDFLYSNYSVNRIVEFYAPWCPHCKYFRPHFIDLSKQVHAIVDDQHTAPVEVYGVSCTWNKYICKDFVGKGYPVLKIFKAGQVNATGDFKYWRVHPFKILSALDIRVDERALSFSVDEIADEAEYSFDPTSNRAWWLFGPKKARKRTKQDVFDDAYQSFYFAVSNAIFSERGQLSMARQYALKEWLELLDKAVPPDWQIQTLVQALLMDFKIIVKHEDNLQAVLAKFDPPSGVWSDSCSHGDETSGYTCGLWQLFHIVTVGVVEWNIDHGHHEFIRPERAAVTIRNYVEYFFDCEVCRENFIASYDACAHDRCHRLHKSSNLIHLPIWLYETHNAVNVRLVHEKGQREHFNATTEQEVARTWPYREDCPACWKTDEVTQETVFDMENVYKFLRIEYWPDDALTKQFKLELFGRTDDGSRRRMILIRSSLFVLACVLLIVSASFFSVKGSRKQRGNRWFSLPRKAGGTKKSLPREESSSIPQQKDL